MGFGVATVLNFSARAIYISNQTSEHVDVFDVQFDIDVQDVASSHRSILACLAVVFHVSSFDLQRCRKFGAHVSVVFGV